MMGIPNIMGLFTVIPVAMLLAVSFFVLVVARKVDSEPLKGFGYVIAVIIWAAVLLVLSLGTYEVVTGKHPVMQFMKESMCHKMGEMGGKHGEMKCDKQGEMKRMDKSMQPAEK